MNRPCLTNSHFKLPSMRVTWSPQSAWPFDITLAWDPNSEPDLAGYKIHYGKISRYQATDLIEKWCQGHEPRNTQCIDERKVICDVSGQPDPSCHPMLFQYDHVVDVGNVTEHALTDLDEGDKYFFLRQPPAIKIITNHCIPSSSSIHSTTQRRPNLAS